MLLVCGFRRAGKTTFSAEVAQSDFMKFRGFRVFARGTPPPLSTWAGANIVNFASPIRQVVAAQFGLDPGPSFDDAKDNVLRPIDGSTACTPRSKMIEYGSEMRQTRGENYWADIAIGLAGNRAIFGDFRFLAEYRAAFATGAPTVVARIIRPVTAESDITELDCLVPDLIVIDEDRVPAEYAQYGYELVRVL